MNLRERPDRKICNSMPVCREHGGFTIAACPTCEIARLQDCIVAISAVADNPRVKEICRIAIPELREVKHD